MLISPAYAQAAGGLGGIPPDILLLVAIGAIFYFLLLRPQQKQRKAHREMLENLRRGDQVVTGGGIIGKVTKVNNETELTVEIAEDIRVTIARGTISAVIDLPHSTRSATACLPFAMATFIQRSEKAPCMQHSTRRPTQFRTAASHTPVEEQVKRKTLCFVSRSCRSLLTTRS